MAMFLPNRSLFVEAKPDPLFWVKIFVSAIVQVVSGLTTHCKLILEIDEPEADQFFGVKKSVKIPPQALWYYSYSMQGLKGSSDAPN